MKILYGVVGEGMGHAIRSRVVIEHLVSQGHHVKVVVSGRAYTFLTKYFDDVVQIEGLGIVYEDNAVDRSATAWSWLSNAAAWALDNANAYVREVFAFGADVVISDFDSFAHLYGIAHGKPVLSIDNQHAIPFLEHDDDVFEERSEDGTRTKSWKSDFDLARRLIRNKMRGCSHYLITTFFDAPIKEKYRDRASLFPPILRDEILAAKARAVRGDHVLVYQTSASYVAMLDVLATQPGEFHVYGFLRPDAPAPPGVPEGDDVRFAPNVLLRRFSEGGFIDDLASCRAVITGGGFTLIGEAIYLGKPLYSVPVQKHFEQIVSARYLEKLHYGEHHQGVTGTEVAGFLAQADSYAESLKNHVQDGNRALLAKVDALVERHGR